MLLRKINAVLSLLCTLFLLDHAVFHALWMMSKGTMEKSVDSMPRILFCLMLAHAFISIYFGITAHKGAEKRKCNGYPKLNMVTNFQRASGVIMILLTLLHIAGTTGHLHTPYIIHVIQPPIFFAIVLMHTAVSSVKALITLGIGNAKLIKTADIVMKALCGITLVADIVGFFIYLS